MKMKTLRVLDIDLDFFLDCHERPQKTQERAEIQYEPWKPEDVTRFLEGNCGLDLTILPRGKLFIKHDEVYQFCKNLRKENDRIKFHIDHVDAHADLGINDAGVIGLFTDIDLIGGGDWITEGKEKEYELNPGNFLLFFLFQGWLASLTYINHSHLLNDDINTFILSNRNDKGSKLCAKYFEDMNDLMADQNGVESRCISPVPFFSIDYRQFNNCHQYDYVLLSQSPDYTPFSSDELIRIISKYFKEEQH